MVHSLQLLFGSCLESCQRCLQRVFCLTQQDDQFRQLAIRVMQLTEGRVSSCLCITVVLGALLVLWELLAYDHKFTIDDLQTAAAAPSFYVACTCSIIISLSVILVSVQPQLINRQYVPETVGGWTLLSSRGQLSCSVRCFCMLACITATDICYTLGGAFELQFILIFLNGAAAACTFLIAAPPSRLQVSENSDLSDSSEDSSSDDNSELGIESQSHQTLLLYAVHACGGVYVAALLNVFTEPSIDSVSAWLKAAVLLSIPALLLILLYRYAPFAFDEISARFARVADQGYDRHLRAIKQALSQHDWMKAAVSFGSLISPILAALLAALLMVLGTAFMAARHREQARALSLPMVVVVSFLNCMCITSSAARSTISDKLSSCQRRAALAASALGQCSRSLASSFVTRVRPYSRRLSKALEGYLLREGPRLNPNSMAGVLSNKLVQVLCVTIFVACWSLFMGSLSASRHTKVVAVSRVSSHTFDISVVDIDAWASVDVDSVHWMKATQVLQRRRQLMSHMHSVGQGHWETYSDMLDEFATLAQKQYKELGQGASSKQNSGLRQSVPNGNSRLFERRELQLSHALAASTQFEDSLTTTFFWCGHFGLFPVAIGAGSVDASPWSDCLDAGSSLLSGNTTSHIRQDVLPSYYLTRKSLLSRLQCRATNGVPEHLHSKPYSSVDNSCSPAAKLVLLPKSPFSRVFPLTLALPQDTTIALTLLKPTPFAALSKYIDSHIAARGQDCTDCTAKERMDGDGIEQDLGLLLQLQNARHGKTGQNARQDLSVGFVLKSTLHSDSSTAQEWHKREQERIHTRPVIHAEPTAVANSTHVLVQRLRDRVSAMRARGRLCGSAASMNGTSPVRKRSRPGHYNARLRNNAGRKLQVATNAWSGHKSRTTNLKPFYDVFQAKVDALRLSSGRVFGVALNVVVLLKPLRIYTHQVGIAVSVSASPNHPVKQCSLNSHAADLPECHSDDAALRLGEMSAQEMLSYVAQELDTSTAQVWNRLSSQASRAVLAIAQYTSGFKQFDYDQFTLVGDVLPPFFGKASQFMARLQGQQLSQAFKLDMVFDRSGHVWVVDMEPHHDERQQSKKELFSTKSAARRVAFDVQQFWLLGSGRKPTAAVLQPLQSEVCSTHAPAEPFFENSMKQHFGGHKGLVGFISDASASYQQAVASGKASIEQKRLTEQLSRAFTFHKEQAQHWNRSCSEPASLCDQEDLAYIERFLHEHLQLSPDGWFRAFPVADLNPSTAQNRTLCRPSMNLGTSGLRYPSICGSLTRAEEYQADRDYTRLMQPIQEAAASASTRPGVLYAATMHALQRRYEWYRHWAAGHLAGQVAAQPSHGLLWLAKEWFKW